jgi:hypothetical protein
MGACGKGAAAAAGAALAAGVIACGTGQLPKPDSRIGEGLPFAVVDIRPTGGNMTEQLAKAADEAARANLRPYVELTSAWCRACHWLDRGLSKRSVAQAFGGTYIVRVDVDHWEGLLGGSGLDNHDGGPLPAFIALSQRGHPIGGWVDRADWSSDVPELAAPVLADFFHWP